MNKKDCGCNKELDRYVSFNGIDCNGNARRDFRWKVSRQ